jgi:serine/threonine-protein kinase
MVKPGMFISDRYEIIDKVGTGGTADVYKARCHRLNRFVAIKILKAEYSDDKNFVGKFRAEAQSAAGLSHPNIVNVYDVGEDNGLYYIVMELVEGITLKTFVERKERLEVKEALAIAIQIAQGMEAAHENHIIHRDIKPQNIIISKDGKVKVTDFGIAKAASSNTITSNAMGSVHYISPEQARGGYSDERSDIYSLGITLYEMLSGRVPYIADTTVSVALLHIQGEAEPLHNLVPGIPASVEHIVEKCMQKKPEYRYQSASELIRDLKRAITSPEEDFVRIKGAEVNSSPTINISDQELNQIKNGRVRAAAAVQETGETEEDGENTESEYAENTRNGENTRNTGNVAQAQKLAQDKAVQEKNMQNTEKNEKKEVKKEDEDEWEEEDEIEPRLKKVMLIVGVVTAVIFLIVMIVIIAKITGVFHKTTQEPDQTNQEEVLEPEDDDTLSSDEEEQPDDEDAEASEDDETLKIVPSVLELSQSEAEKQLEESGFLVSVKESYSDTVKEGYVISQSPEAEQELEEGGNVTIYVSLGAQKEEKRTFTLDDLSGQTESDVTSYLDTNGLVKQTTSKYSDSVSAGYIISTSPAAGSTVTEGDTITLIVSAGPEEKMAEVPKITDITEAEAKAALKAAKLSVGDVSYVYSSSYAEGVVMAQDVKAGKEVKENTAVGFTVSKGPKEETKPEETETKPEETTYYYADYYIGVENSPLDDEEEGEITLVLTQDGKESVLYQKTITGEDFPLTNTIKSTSSSAGKLNMLLDGADTGFQTSVTFK